MKDLGFSTTFIYRIKLKSLKHGLQCLSGFKPDTHFQLYIWVISFTPLCLLCSPVLPRVAHWPSSKDNLDFPRAVLMQPWATVIHAWVSPLPT